MILRPATLADAEPLSHLRAALWPEAAVDEHRKEIEAIVAGNWSATYPYVIFVAVEGEIVGFAEATLRSRADGCDASRPVGYLEGWYVAEGWRGRGIGAELLNTVEAWASEQGCVELASDTWIDNEGSQRAHEALGFEVVDRVVNYRKRLGRRDR